MSRLWAKYNAILDKQPLLTKACTSFVGFTLGDSLAQNVVNPDNAPYDIVRALRLGSFGFLVHGTTGHFFYGFLDRRFPGRAPITVATKVFIDQGFRNPLFGLSFFTFLNFTEGKSFEDLKNKLKADFTTVVIGSWCCWVPAHTINFAYVPPKQRLLYVNSIQVVYNVFLSFLGNKKVDTDPDSEEKEL